MKRSVLVGLVLCLCPFAMPAGAIPPEETATITSVAELKDVTPADPAFSAIQSLVERYGFLRADAQGNFRPAAPLQRGAFASWLNSALDTAAQLQGAYEEINSLDPAARDAFVTEISPRKTAGLAYQSSSLADAKTATDMWCGKAIASVIDTHGVNLAVARGGKYFADPDAAMTRDQLRATLSAVFGTPDAILDTSEIEVTKKPATRVGPVTRSEAALALNGALDTFFETQQPRVAERMKARSVELARELTDRFKIEISEENLKKLAAQGDREAWRGLLLDVMYGATIYIQKSAEAARHSPGVKPAMDAPLIALFPGKYAEAGAADEVKRGLVSDLASGELPLMRLGYLDMIGVYLRVKPRDTTKPPTFGPNRPVTVQLVRGLMTDVLKDTAVEPTGTASAAMVLKQVRDALARHDAKVKAVLAGG